MKKNGVIALSMLGCAMFYSLVNNKQIDIKGIIKTRRKYIEIHRESLKPD